MVILGDPCRGDSGSLQTLLERVADEERQLAADAFQAAVEHGDEVMVSCRLHAGDGSVRSVLITAEISDDEPSGVSMSALLRMDGLAAATGPWLVGHVLDLTTLRAERDPGSRRTMPSPKPPSTGRSSSRPKAC